MSSKTSHERPSGVLQWLYERGEETAAQVLEELFRNRAVTEGVAKTIRRAAQTKGQIDRNMQTLLSLLNLPSRADYAKLTTKIEALQGSLVNLNMKLDRLLAATASPAKPHRKRPVKPSSASPPHAARADSHTA
jgi:polyhydroxyalkanoate synthesis regulator phasin